MSVDFHDSPAGHRTAQGALIARARAASARSRSDLRAAAVDFAMSTQARLDDEARTAIRGDLARLTGAIETDLRYYGGVASSSQSAHKLASGVDVAERLIAAGLLADEVLMSELIDRAWCAIVAARLPLSIVSDSAKPSLLPRLAADPNQIVAEAANAMLLADARRRGDGGHVGRNDLPAELQHRLVWWIAAALRPTTPTRAGDLALIDGARRVLSAHDEGARLEAAADRLVLALDPPTNELPALIEEALGERRLVLVAALIGHGAGIETGIARSMLLDPAGDRLWLALRAVDAPRALIVRLAMALSQADRRRDANMFIRLLDPLMTMTPATAADAFAALKFPEAFREACARMEPAQ